MSDQLSQFEEYKLRTSFYDDYCEHTYKSRKAERWRRGKVLGQGGFGVVWLEKEKKGALRAVKQISKRKIKNTAELLALTKLNMVRTSP